MVHGNWAEGACQRGSWNSGRGMDWCRRSFILDGSRWGGCNPKITPLVGVVSEQGDLHAETTVDGSGRRKLGGDPIQIL